MYPTSMSGSCDPSEGVQGQVFIAKYHQSIYHIDDLQKEIDAGSALQFNIFIENIGNYDETYSFDVVNSEELSEKGFKIDFSANSLKVPKNGNQSFKVLVDTPNDERWEGQHNIQISISPQSATDDIEQSHLVELKVVIKYKSGIEYVMDYTPFIIILIAIVVALVLLASWHKKRQLLLIRILEEDLKKTD